MRLLVIGDIHGYSEALKKLLAQVSPGPDDQLVFLGDYVDKGPDVAGVLDALIELKQKVACVFLRGNHDQMLVAAYRDATETLAWEAIAGSQPLRSYGKGSTAALLSSLPTRHIEFLEKECVDYYETKQFIFVHAGIRPSVSPADESQDTLHLALAGAAEPHSSGRTVICGHTSQGSGRILDLGHTICLDTGITKGRFLTCLDLSDFSYVQVSLRRLWRSVRRGRLKSRERRTCGRS